MAMSLSGWGKRIAALLFLGLFWGCAMPSTANPQLTAAAAQNALDSWNPNYCKVAEFYGFHQEDGRNSQVAYVLIVDPSDKAKKPTVYAAQFQLLVLPGGQQRWFLTSLVTHGSGLTRRQGWDNLIVPVREPGPAAAK
jgi:hypothetical protein